MLPAFILTLREGLEIALIIGIVLGALRKMQRKDLIPTVWLGFIIAVAASLCLNIALQSLDASLEGRSEEIFEGIMMLGAAVLLTWMIFWMQGHAKAMQTSLEAGVQRASRQTGKKAIFLLTFLAVVREGFELVIFLSASALSSQAQQTLTGAVLGLAAASLIGWLIFTATVRLNLSLFFQATSILLILFAAGLVAQAVHELNEAGMVPPVIEHVWDTNTLLNEDSTSGSILKTLFGYNGNPSLSEVLAYASFFIVILVGLRIGNINQKMVQEA